MKSTLLCLMAIATLAFTAQSIHAAPDVVDPVIELKGSETVSMTVGSTYTEQGVTATDDVDGDITSKVTIKNKVKANKQGTYTVKYNVKDAAGNKALEVIRTVIVNPLVIAEPDEAEIPDADVIQEETPTEETTDETDIMQQEEAAQGQEQLQQNGVQEEVLEDVQSIVLPQEETPIVEETEFTGLATTTFDGDYTLVTTMPSSLKQGEISTIEITLTNNAGPEEFVFYTFLSQIQAGASVDDEGAFMTDKFFEGQELAVGQSKTYSFPWLNDESAGSYKFFGEIKSVDWSETLQKNQIGQVKVSGVKPQSIGQSLHRFYSHKFRGHFYTTSEVEKQNLIDNDANWIYEGIGNKTVNTDSLSSESMKALSIKPVYRFWNDKYKHHFYTVSESEKEATIADPNWKYEDVAYYTYTARQMDTIEVFRFYSPVYKGHFYTTSSDERDDLIKNDSNWTYEGIAWYAQR